MSATYVVEANGLFGAIVRPTSSRVVPPQSPELCELLLRHRLLILRGFEPFVDKTAIATYASTWGPLLEWSFGYVFEVVEHESPNNYLFTSGSVPYHWDGAFASQVPWLQVFQCVESTGVEHGGETLFCDTSLIWQSLDAEKQSLWNRIEMEYATQKVAHYGGRVRAKLVDTHPLTGEAVVRFNEPANATTVDLNTPEVIPHGLPESEMAGLIADVTRRLYDPAVSYAHTWQTGDCLIADNFVLLHGRSAYRSKLPRRLWRVHVLSMKGNLQ